MSKQEKATEEVQRGELAQTDSRQPHLSRIAYIYSRGADA